MTLAESLPREIERVSELREFYRQIGRDNPGVLVMPAIAFMTSAIEEAHAAILSGDIARMLRANEELKGFNQ